MREAPYAAALRHKVLSKQEEHELCTRLAALRAEHGSEHPQTIAVRNQLVQANLKLIVKMAKRNRRLPFEDAMSEGVKGLIRAAEDFEPERGWRFCTYAAHWIRSAVQRATLNIGDIVRVPVHKHEKLSHGEITADGVKLFARPVSLDAPLVEGDTGSLHDRLAAEDAPASDELGDQRLSEDVRRAVLAVLTPREREIIESRYLRANEETLQEVGDRMPNSRIEGGLSRERIRQLETLAFAKLRRALKQYAQEASK